MASIGTQPAVVNSFRPNSLRLILFCQWLIHRLGMCQTDDRLACCIIATLTAFGLIGKPQVPVKRSSTNLIWGAADFQHLKGQLFLPALRCNRFMGQTEVFTRQ
jgi:hypothetical protein